MADSNGSSNEIVCQVHHLPEPLATRAVYEKVRNDIEETGWTAISIVDVSMAFTYTVGLRDSYDHPELIVYGLNPSTAHGVLWAAVRALEEHPFEAGQLRDDLIEDRDGNSWVARVHLIPLPGKPLNIARQWHHRDETALQIVWPDPGGRFPGNPGYDSVRFEQPLGDGQTE